MPLIDGYEFAKRAKRLFIEAGMAPIDHPKLVAVTGNVECSYIQECFSCNFDQVFSKPITSDKVAMLLLE